MAKQLQPQEIADLWGDEGPYSQVQVIREIRILDDSVSRVFHYVTANINPTTFRILQELKGRIQHPGILACLAEGKFVSPEDGYEWTAYGECSDSPRTANKVAKQIAELIIRMHHMVMQELGMRSDLGHPSEVKRRA
jgi:hypothetical protein